jgi:hypothetical protein
MHLFNPHIRLAAAAAALVAAFAPAAAPAANDSADGDSALPAIVLPGLGEDGRADRFIPGVTDSGTGVLRERERRGIQTPALVASDSGFDLAGGDGAVVLAGALAAAAVAASLALGAGARRRRILT